jgi:hypothetical protein
MFLLTLVATKSLVDTLFDITVPTTSGTFLAQYRISSAEVGLVDSVITFFTDLPTTDLAFFISSSILLEDVVGPLVLYMKPCRAKAELHV